MHTWVDLIKEMCISGTAPPIREEDRAHVRAYLYHTNHCVRMNSAALAPLDGGGNPAPVPPDVAVERAAGRIGEAGALAVGAVSCGGCSCVRVSHMRHP